MIKSFKDLESVELSAKRIAVVWPSDENTVKAIIKAKDVCKIRPVMIGHLETTISLLKDYELEENSVEIHPVDTPEEAAVLAVELGRIGEVDAIMKGKIDTSVLLKEVVNKEIGINTGKVMSHFVVHELNNYPKLLALSDGGMNLYPTLENKKAILENAVESLIKLGVKKPNVAVLTAVEKVNPKMPETVDAAKLKEMNEKGEIKNCFVEGPISYDLAMSKKSASVKGYSSPVTEDVDLLLVPNITVGNILGKSLVYTAGAQMAGVIVGAKVPIILTSRGSTFEEKYFSILLAGALSNNNE